MKKGLFFSALLPSALMLSACSGTWEAEATCSTSGPCSVTGRVKGTFKSTADQPSTIFQMIAQSASVMDAAQFSIDVSGSTVGVPVNGLVTIKLIHSQTGALQAQNTFSWVKSGTDLVLVNPNAVNSWAMSQGGTADSMEYVLHPFAVTQSSGPNQLQASTQYEGTTYVSAVAVWSGSGGGCRFSCQEN
jgi:hypothetical protein